MIRDILLFLCLIVVIGKLFVKDTILNDYGCVVYTLVIMIALFDMLKRNEKSSWN